MSDKSDYTQTINFTGSDNDLSTKAVVNQDVKVICSAGTHTHGSSKVKLTDLSGYNWEVRYYRGQLIAVHVSANIFAYSMTIKGAGSINIVNKETGKRGRIKDLKKQVLDISFALIPQQVILGCIDGEASVFVYEVDVENVPVCHLLLHVIHPTVVAHPINNCRIIWCPYIPSHGEDVNTKDDPAKLFAFLNGSKAEVWDVCLVNKEYQYGKVPLQPKTRDGYVEVDGHTEDIIDASFSPDGTALATAGLDGYVKFFQVYMIDDKNTHCLHEFVPHDGDALSCLLFLDDIKQYGTADSRFWKFAVTGSKNNSEIKIWSCITWLCLQTVQFTPNPKSHTPDLFFKVGLDMSGQYLITSEINNRLLYVLQLERNDSEGVATVSYISQFLLPAPFLSFCIVDADMSKFRYSNSTEELYKDEQDDYDENLFVNVIEVNMCAIQPNKLQDCYIKFQPETTGGKIANNGSRSPEMPDESVTNEDLKEDELAKLNELQNSVSLLIQQHSNQHHPQLQPHHPQLNLMTPDAFSSPVHNSSPSSVRNSLGNDSSAASAILNKSLEKLSDGNVENLIDFQRPQKDNFASGGSSPSREVQEILSLNNSSYTQEFFDNLNKLENDDENKEIVWPNIPLAKANEIVKEENRRQEMRLGAGDDVEHSSDDKWNKIELQMITFRLNSLENLVREQNVHIQKLQHELKAHGKSQSLEGARAFSTEIELAMSKNHIQMAKLFDNYVAMQKNKDRELQENLMACVTQILSKQLSDKMQNLIVHEIKHVVLPAVLAIFESLKHQLDIQYSQKLNSTDHLLKDNIAKLVTSKAIGDSLSASIVGVVKPSLEQCYKDMITSTLIPSWERICSTMFQQINETFTQGTKEYTASVETYMERQRRVQDVGKDLIAQMQNISEGMKTNSEKLTNNLVQEVHRQFSISINSMQDKLTRNLVDMLGEQINQGFKNHASLLEDSLIHAVRSRSVTPSPHVIDTQVQLAQIQQLVAKGSIEVAFQQALSASDLSLVTCVCERVDPQEIFKDGKCILQQHVLLSLIQQLSADLVHNTAVKHKYLEEALLYLQDLPITNEHIPVILRDLVRQISIFLTTYPTNKHVKHLKMLLLATQSLLKS